MHHRHHHHHHHWSHGCFNHRHSLSTLVKHDAEFLNLFVLRQMRLCKINSGVFLFVFFTVYAEKVRSFNPSVFLIFKRRIFKIWFSFTEEFTCGFSHCQEVLLQRSRMKFKSQFIHLIRAAATDISLLFTFSKFVFSSF